MGRLNRPAIMVYGGTIAAGNWKGKQLNIISAFEALGEKASRKPCKAMKGLVEEGQDIIEEDAEEAVHDAGLICAAQKIEHYEIASYGTVVAWAEKLGHSDLAELLSETLEEEKETDEKLTELAESAINIEASQDA